MAEGDACVGMIGAIPLCSSIRDNEKMIRTFSYYHFVQMFVLKKNRVYENGSIMVHWVMKVAEKASVQIELAMQPPGTE